MTHKTKDRVTRTPLKIGAPHNGTHHVILATKPWSHCRNIYKI